MPSHYGSGPVTYANGHMLQTEPVNHHGLQNGSSSAFQESPHSTSVDALTSSMSNSQLVDSCLRVLQDKPVDPRYDANAEPTVSESESVRHSVDVSYHPATSNGHHHHHHHHPHNRGHLGESPGSSQLSVHSSEANTTLVSRTQKQQTTQQITTTTKVIRELHHIGPDGQPVYKNMDAYRPPSPGSEAGSRRNYDPYRPGYGDYEHYPRNDYPYGNSPYGGGRYGNYADSRDYVDQPGYSDRPPTPPTPSERSESPPPQKALQQGYPPGPGTAAYPQSGYAELDSTLMPPRVGQDPYRNSPSPGVQGAPLTDSFEPSVAYNDSPPPYTSPLHGGGYDPSDDAPTTRTSPPAPRAMFDDEDQPPDHPPPPENYPRRPPSTDSRGTVRWRDPDLHEVIEFLSNPTNVVKANAAAYLQHLCYMDDPMKQKTRALGGIPPLVALLAHDIPEVHRNACGALRNLSYGRQNDENKRAIRNAGGIPSLIRLLRKTPENEVKELVTSILWNLSSCEDLKKQIIDDGLAVLVNYVIIPHSGWNRSTPHGEPGVDVFWSTVFRNATGVLRNVSSAGEYARRKLRECEGLVDSILLIVRSALNKSNIDNKCVENCVCVLRNLSYRCQEVEDPNYDKNHIPPGSRAAAGQKADGDNSGCFGASKKKKDSTAQQKDGTGIASQSQRGGPVRGMELLWQPEVVQPYLSLLSDCSNPETLEAAAGAIQNLAACYWQPSIDVRAAVRKEKGLPILVELLRMEVDRVVCAVATALRNLAIDQRNKELIGKYAMRDLVVKLPSGVPQHDQVTSDETIAAVLATLNEVIKKNAEFSRALFDTQGVERLLNVTKQRNRYSPRVVKFASQVLYSMWAHQELREVYRKGGWKEQDFVTKSVAARNAAPNSPSNANSTLNRPMASQGGTRYEDRTLQRGQGSRPHPQGHGEEVAMADLNYADRGHGPPPGGGKPGEPVYAQVNREKKRSNRPYDNHLPPPMYDNHYPAQQLPPHQPGPGDMWGYSDHQYAPSPLPPPGHTNHQQQDLQGQEAGDSWV